MSLLEELQEKYNSYIDCETFITKQIKKVLPRTLTCIHFFDHSIGFSHWITHPSHHYDDYSYANVVQIIYDKYTNTYRIESCGNQTEEQVKYFLEQLKTLLNTERKNIERKNDESKSI